MRNVTQCNQFSEIAKVCHFEKVSSCHAKHTLREVSGHTRL